MKTISIVIFSILLLAACATEPDRYDQDKHDPAYWNGAEGTFRSGGLAPRPLPASQNPPVPGAELPASNMPPTSADNGAAAVGGALAAVTSLALNPDYYKQSAITGRVVCLGKGDNNIEIPCGIVDIVMVDGRGNEVAESQTDQDRFAFLVKRNVAYRLRVQSKHYAMDVPETKKLVLGDDVTLHLITK